MYRGYYSHAQGILCTCNCLIKFRYRDLYTCNCIYMYMYIKGSIHVQVMGIIILKVLDIEDSMSKEVMAMGIIMFNIVTSINNTYTCISSVLCAVMEN